MRRRRIRGLLIIAGLAAGIKMLRDTTMKKNRERSPEIVEGLAASSPIRPARS